MSTIDNAHIGIRQGAAALDRVCSLAIQTLNDVRDIDNRDERHEAIDRAYRDIAAILLEVLP